MEEKGEYDDEGRQGFYIMGPGELGSIIPIKWSTRDNTAAIYQHKGSKTRRGEKSFPVQRQGSMVMQIKYVYAENIRLLTIKRERS